MSGEAPATTTAPAPAEESTVFARGASRPWIMTAAVICIFMTAIEGTVVATAMPTIVSQLGDFHLFSWVFSAYFLTQAVSIPLSGRFADLFGRKPMLFFGLTLFLLGSSACGLAPNMLTLICFRVVQGIGAGCTMPVTQTLISDIYPPAIRARIQGYLSWHLGNGGDLRSADGCGDGDGGELALGLLDQRAARHRRLRPARRRPARAPHPPQPSIDYVGAVLMAGGIGLLMFALNQATSFGLTLFLVLLVIAIVLLVLSSP